MGTNTERQEPSGGCSGHRQTIQSSPILEMLLTTAAPHGLNLHSELRGLETVTHTLTSVSGDCYHLLQMRKEAEQPQSHTPGPGF